jgi:SAM-dependent methyltransferase
VVRSFEPEILDSVTLPQSEVDRAYRDLTRLHRVLGDTRRIVHAIRRDPLPVRRVLDIGCASGGVMADVQRRLGVEVIGVDLRPPVGSMLPIVQADAVRDRLPEADVAYSMCLGHHLSDEDLAAMLVNVGRSCRRFIFFDLCRHWLPLALFRAFVAPLFVSPVAVVDGQLSIKRAFTPEELAGLARSAGVRFRHSVSPFYASQILDIRY